tara:strand:- start:399 stop:830 length:432 start_codon:yes stop_codon:yes gene_type:complete
MDLVPLKNNININHKINPESIKQSNLIKKQYQNLCNNANYNLMTNGFQSINDNLDYVECINNNNCYNLTNETILNKNLIKNKKTNSNNVIIKSLDIFVSFVYIFLLVILLLGSVIKRDTNNLINILIITLIYLFYQIYISNKK